MGRSRIKTFLYMFTVSVSLALALTGCGGGGVSAPPPPVSVIEGFVSDGPIENARVFLDINCNGEWDAGEPFSITNNEGYYRIEYSLDSGTDYLLVAEGSSDLNTQDINDNPGDENRLTFVMFVKITTDGKRNSPRLSMTYNQDITPLTFKSYLNDINMSMGGMNDPIIDQIIASDDTGTEIFKEIIKVNQIKFKSTLMYIAKLVQLSNTEKDLQATKTEAKAAGTLKTILNENLVSILRDGNTEQAFPGLGSYIDTKVLYRGNDMFLGLGIDETVKEILNENFRRYLNLSDEAPEFYGGSYSSGGITIDSSKKMINVILNETGDETGAATITVNWSFGVNKIVRSYEKKYVGGEKKGSTHSSIYTYSTGTNYRVDTNLTNVVFKEAIDERYLSADGYTQTLSASYEGTAIYERDGTDNSLRRLVSAKFNQRLSEYNSHTKHSNTVDGIVTMRDEDDSGNLTFDGSYSFYLPSYGIVSGMITVTSGTYAMGYDDGTYVNNNNFDGTGVAFTSQSDYANYTVTQYPVWLRGTWIGDFTDSCNAKDGQLTMNVYDITASWWGEPEAGPSYGTAVEIVEIDGSYIVRLKNDSEIWSNDVEVKKDDTNIDGTWSYNGCYGNFSLHKCISCFATGG